MSRVRSLQQSHRRGRGLIALSAVGALFLPLLSVATSASGFVEVPQSGSLLHSAELLPEITDTDQAALESAIDFAVSTGDPVAVDELTTESQLITALPSGGLQATLSPGPVRVPDGPNDSWVDIDTTLVVQPDGSFAPRHAVSDVAISGGGNEALAELGTESTSMSVDWPGSLPTPVIDGSTATYPEVLSGVDLVARATASGFSTYLVVKTPAAATNPALKAFTLPIDTQGVDLVAQGDGTLVAKDLAGNVVFESSEALMWDSKGVPEGDEGDSTELVDQSATARSADVAVTLSSGGDMVVAPNMGLLTNPAADYPIIIDPEWHDYPVLDKSAWAMVWSNNNDWVNSETQVPRVGYDGWSSATKKSRVFYRYALPGALSNATVASATFQHKMTHSPNHSCTANSYGASVDIYRTENFTSSVGWPGPTFKGFQDTVSKVTGSEDAPYNCPSKVVEWNVLQGVEGAYSGGESVVVFGMRSANESDKDGWRKFANGGRPNLIITYDTPPQILTEPYVIGNAVPSSPGASGAQWTNDNTPLLESVVRDAEGDLLKICYTIETLSGTQKASGCDTSVTTSSTGASVKASVSTTPALTADGTYYLRAVLTDLDNSGMTDTSSFRRQMTLDKTPPPAPTFVSSTPPAGGWMAGGTAGSVSISLPLETTTQTVRYLMNSSTAPTCASPSVVSVPAGGAGTPTQVVLPVRPSQPGANDLQVVTCDLVGNQSLGVMTYTISDVAAPPLVHEWKWNSEVLPAPGADTGVVSAVPATSLAPLADVTTPDRVRNTLVTPGPRDGEPDSNQWLRLGGAQQYAQTGASALTGLNGSGFSVSAWVKVDPAITAGTVTQVIASQAGSTVDAVRLAATPTGWYFTVANGDSNSGAMTASATYAAAECSPGEWCYVSGTWNPSTKRPHLFVYKNTITSKAFDPPSTPANGVDPGAMAGRFRVGVGQVGGTSTAPSLSLLFKGGIDSVRVFAHQRRDSDLLADATAQ